MLEAAPSRKRHPRPVVVFFVALGLMQEAKLKRNDEVSCRATGVSKQEVV